jgi:LacI family transcriptional regulator
VLTAIESLGYRRDEIARSLRMGATKVWGLVISDIENPFFTSLVRGVQDQADQEGYAVVLLNSDEDLEKEARCLTLLLEARVAGVILTPVTERDANAALPASASTPLVVVDRRISGIPLDMVTVDNVQGAYQGTLHLLDAGYRRISCIAGPEHVATGSDRLRGYFQALRERGVEPDPALVRTTNFKQDGGYEAASQLLRQEPRTDAIIVMNNLTTEGALQAVQDLGLRVPGDVALVAFDDLAWSSLVQPGLTAVAQPVRELGRTAAQLLARRCRGDMEGFPSTVVLQPTLKVRQSSAAEPSR